MSHEILDGIGQAVIDMRFEDTEGLTKKALEAGVAPVEIINSALLPALDRVGILFREGDYFLPDVLMSVKAYNNSFKLLEPLLKEGDYKARGRIMLVTSSVMAKAKIPSVKDSSRFFSMRTFFDSAGSVIPIALC